MKSHFCCSDIQVKQMAPSVHALRSKHSKLLNIRMFVAVLFLAIWSENKLSRSVGNCYSINLEPLESFSKNIKPFSYKTSQRPIATQLRFLRS